MRLARMAAVLVLATFSVSLFAAQGWMYFVTLPGTDGKQMKLSVDMPGEHISGKVVGTDTEIPVYPPDQARIMGKLFLKHGVVQFLPSALCGMRMSSSQEEDAQKKTTVQVRYTLPSKKLDTTVSLELPGNERLVDTPGGQLRVFTLEQATLVFKEVLARTGDVELAAEAIAARPAGENILVQKV